MSVTYPKVGTPVLYVNRKGHQKLAFVIVNPDTFDSGTNFSLDTESDQILAVVFGISETYRTTLYSRETVLAKVDAALEDVESDDPDVAMAGRQVLETHQHDGGEDGVSTIVRYWTPVV